jgi:hypothetical protein
VTILLTPFAHGELCHGNTWSIQDQSKLADHIASVALGQSRHVERILAGANLSSPLTTGGAVAGAIALLTVANGDPWHRDGWVFQVMSWIAAHIAKPGSYIRPPHMIAAHKGFDGLQLEMDDTTGAVGAIIIFEDKATDNPRKTIRDEVWRDFKELEAGDRENVLTAEIVALLQTLPGVNPDIAIQNILWKQARHYRVSITVGDTHATDKGRVRLFRDYDTVASGVAKKRRAETFHVKDLRKWMDGLALQAIAAILTKATVNV